MESLVINDRASNQRVWRSKPWYQCQLYFLHETVSGLVRQPEQDHRTHLRATMEWLCHAHDACRNQAGQDGLSAGWNFESGWLPDSPELSGSLVETLVAAAEYLVWPALKERAVALHQYLLAQLASGIKPSFGVLRGVLAGYVHFQSAGSLHEVLPRLRQPDLTETESAWHHAQAAWLLAWFARLSGEDDLLEVAQQHLDILLRRQTPCGWVRQSAYNTQASSLSMIAATHRGMLEAALILDNVTVLRAAEQGMRSLMALQRSDGRLAGAYDDGWTPTTGHVCLSGLTQTAVVWLRLAQICHDVDLRNAAWRACVYVKRIQRIRHADPAVRAAIPSTLPLWRSRKAYNYSTLSAKYFADALMMDMVNITIPPMHGLLHP
jgi:hypothetical protein